ncbi:hypothetical protein RFI_24217 [Reticulomyxa filosa]|uniref:Uncharacterized protein n=1 Tax=Reticulomyxa filosa TaxID=46433 RepID=X6MI92_RETFI|nr:hypothetical protein RFI_24217 [Reticulomyxa filosa]|eukprot:ETO13157.1 hypothetical protein RFI_24217 [Reticulomyxa filosa]
MFFFRFSSDVDIRILDLLHFQKLCLLFINLESSSLFCCPELHFFSICETIHQTITTTARVIHFLIFKSKFFHLTIICPRENGNIEKQLKKLNYEYLRFTPIYSGCFHNLKQHISKQKFNFEPKKKGEKNMSSGDIPKKPEEEEEEKKLEKETLEVGNSEKVITDEKEKEKEKDKEKEKEYLVGNINEFKSLGADRKCVNIPQGDGEIDRPVIILKIKKNIMH